MTDYHIHLMAVVEMGVSKGEVSFSRLPWIRCGRAGREAEDPTLRSCAGQEVSVFLARVAEVQPGAA